MWKEFLFNGALGNLQNSAMKWYTSDLKIVDILVFSTKSDLFTKQHPYNERKMYGYLPASSIKFAASLVITTVVRY